jgi:hypothetical protein
MLYVAAGGRAAARLCQAALRLPFVAQYARLEDPHRSQYVVATDQIR